MRIANTVEDALNCIAELEQKNKLLDLAECQITENNQEIARLKEQWQLV